jgi:hypothetical protein
VLARLEAHDDVTEAFLSVDGTGILLAGPSREGLLEACKAALADSATQPQPRPDAEARAAWSDRTDWVSQDELWRLSWREAEAFADRLLAELVRRFGEPVRPLRSLLVESFFEGVRPKDGSGPASKSWEPGATVEARRAVIFARAAELVGPAKRDGLEAFLSDRKAVSAVIRAG